MQINRRIKLLAALLSLLLISLPAYSARADGTETLGDPSATIESGSGMVAAGTGLHSQPGTINLSVPSGVSINQVLLYWADRYLKNLSGDDTITVDNGSGPVSVTGDLIGGPTPAADSGNVSVAYRADITSLGIVSAGANSISVSDFDIDDFEDGAGILVIFDDGSSADIQIADGSDYANAGLHAGDPILGETESQEFSFAAEASSRSASLVMMAGDSEPVRSDTIRVTDNDGNVLLELSDALASTSGEQFDVLNLTFTVPADASSVTVEVISGPPGATRDERPDSINWVAAGLSVAVTPPANPDIDIEKSTNGIDADSPTGPFILVGDAVNWEYVVTNTGDVALSNVEVTDDQGVSVSCPQDTLDVGESMTCTASGAAELGQYANTGTVTGEGPDGTPVNDSDPSHYFGVGPDIDIEKTPDLQKVASGSNVTFTIVVTNTGNVDLFNVEVTDVIAPDCDNVIGDMAIGASVTYDCTLEDVTEDLTNVAVVTGDDGNGNDVTDEDDADVVVEDPKGGEGCTPGYWKQEHHFGSWVGYNPADDYETVFGVDASFTETLLEALKQGGGGEEALGRHAVAALLNAANSDVSYEFTEAEVIALVQEAYDTGDFEGAKNTLAQENERGCPLGRDEDDDECKKEWHGFDFFNKGKDKDDDCEDDEDRDDDNDCKKYDFNFIGFHSNKDNDCDDEDRDDDDDDRDEDDDCEKGWNGFKGFNKGDDCDDDDRDNDDDRDDKDRDNDHDRDDKDRDDDDDDDDENGYGKHRDDDDDDDRKGPPSWLNTGWR